ncbi:MAG TPA: riboflavin synthase [Gammaproteobacteria bacterium]|nr:riboflavin synthase [Gammaproteobacteria bacterium]
MFSGLVKGVGRIATRTAHGDDRRFVVELGSAAAAPLAVGGSIAVNGVCLTAIEVTPKSFAADVSAATLAVTTLGALAAGDAVNLEPPLRAGDPLDGHIVTGHVDGVGEVVTIEPAGRSTRLVIEVPAPLSRYIAAKGSVAVDGVSLTVNAVDGARFEVNIIPHTQSVTVIGGYARGTAVNIEVDMLARYLERLVRAEPDGGIDLAFLRKHGYARDHR